MDTHIYSIHFVSRGTHFHPLICNHGHHACQLHVKIKVFHKKCSDQWMALFTFLSWDAVQRLWNQTWHDTPFEYLKHKHQKFNRHFNEINCVHCPTTLGTPTPTSLTWLMHPFRGCNPNKGLLHALANPVYNVPKIIKPVFRMELCPSTSLKHWNSEYR